MAESSSSSRTSVLFLEAHDPDLKDSADIAAVLTTIARTLVNDFKPGDSPAILDDALTHIHEAIAETPPGCIDLHSRSVLLGVSHLLRYEELNCPEDKEEAERLFERAVRMDPSYSTVEDWQDWEDPILEASFKSGLAGDLVDYITSHLNATRVEAPRSIKQLFLMDLLGNAYFLRYDAHGDLSDLAWGQAWIRATASRIPRHGLYLPSIFVDCEDSLLSRYIHGPMAEDLRLAKWSKSIDTASQEGLHILTSQVLCSLAHCFAKSMLSLTLDERMAVCQLVREDAIALSTDAASLGISALNRAISDAHIIGFRHMLNNNGIDDMLLYQTRHVLASELMRRYFEADNKHDMDEAIELLRINATQSPDFLASMALSDALGVRFRRYGGAADLNEVIARLEGVAAPSVRMVVDLTDYYTARESNVGVGADSHSALTLLRDLIASDVLDQGALARLHSLAVDLHLNRHARFLTLRDIDLAIDHASKSLYLTPDDDPERWQRILALARVRISRGAFTFCHQDLSDSLDLMSGTLHLLSVGNSNRFSYFVQLAELLTRQYLLPKRRFMSPSSEMRYADILNLVVPQIDDLRDESRDLRQRLSFHRHAGGLLECQFLVTREVKYLDSAIERLRTAVELSPFQAGSEDGSVESRDCFLEIRGRLGINLFTRCVHNPNESDFMEYEDILSSVAHFPGAPFLLRVDAAMHLASGRHQTANLGPATEAYDLVADIFGDIPWIELGVRGQLFRIEGIKQLLRDAAACMCERVARESDPARRQEYLARAVEYIEQDQCRVWSQASNLKPDLKSLRAVDRGLADELERVQTALAEGNFDEASLSSPTEGQRHRSYAREWTKLVQRVRETPGFEDFLRPSKYDRLRAAAQNGPIVIINDSGFRQDAVIIPPQGDLILVPLLHSSDFTKSQSGEILGYRTSGPQPKEALVSSEEDPSDPFDPFQLPQRKGFVWTPSQAGRFIHFDCWIFLIEPIVRALQHAGLCSTVPSPHAHLPRLWWVMTGIYSRLVVHSALPEDSQGWGIMDYFISSYTPTISALLQAQESELEFSRTSAQAAPPSILVVAADNVVAHRPLPGIQSEIGAIRRILPVDRVHILEGQEASIANVCNALPMHTWVHFASHGHQDSLNPFSSGLVLNDGVLTTMQIARQSLPHAQFAYLSACETATGADPKSPLISEALHLTAGMQFAGFRSVIGTLWPVEDDCASMVASRVYEELFSNNEAPRLHRTASALHNAMLSLRKEKPRLRYWAPFVHYGI
ncbi:hypothetical protein SISSUDRAFT_1040259 [Sistotremastrum suecicum HHB10207 ss-3]|uniref:CHAT domain-containing protein n=1 Tax=Sistotremastrum suecicum HHB10207 ss-3 TaxID=1314776 RepID=A0A166I1K1_9AGAM|nr:hypothetical protein SISSUDRAFT_1040259 [Sistotremastrum suecicum HHB10207 ss-3]